ncbi:MAG: hypothetical protein FWC87_04620 [Acidimicrobiaceae bacterium]|nr:hypothetical protein [Acidimicrobiaceae bacterium]
MLTTTVGILALDRRPVALAGAFFFALGIRVSDVCLAVAMQALGATILWPRLVLVWTAGFGP